MVKSKLSAIQNLYWHVEALDVNVTTKRKERQYLIPSLCVEFREYLKTVDIKEVFSDFYNLKNEGHDCLFNEYYSKISISVTNLQTFHYTDNDVRRNVYESINEVFFLLMDLHDISVFVDIYDINNQMNKNL